MSNQSKIHYPHRVIEMQTRPVNLTNSPKEIVPREVRVSLPAYIFFRDVFESLFADAQDFNPGERSSDVVGSALVDGTFTPSPFTDSPCLGLSSSQYRLDVFRLE